MVSSLTMSNRVKPSVSRTVFIPQANERMLQLRRWIGSEHPSESNEPVILMLHGFGASTSWLTPLATRLLKSFNHIYALEMPSVGSASGNKQLASPDDLNKRIKDTVNLLSKKSDLTDSNVSSRPVFVIGQSFGGLLATHLGAHPPENLDGMVLLSPFFGVSDYLKDTGNLIHLAYRYVVGQRFPGLIKELFEGRNITDPLTGLSKTDLKFTFPLNPMTLRSIQKLLKTGSAEAQRVNIPTLAFVSGNDKLCDPLKTKASYDTFATPDKTWVSYPEASHNLVWSDWLDSIAEETINWINAHKRPPLVTFL